MYKSAIVIPAYNEEARIGLALAAIGLQKDLSEKHAVVLVDNGSTDLTVSRAKARDLPSQHFGLHIINELEKGTGIASHTGFRYAIDELGVDYIARIDADTVPTTSWMAASLNHFEEHPRSQLVTGPVWAGFDGGVTLTEAVLQPRIKLLDKLGKAIQLRSVGMLRFAPGHNMCTTALAYDEVGGFPCGATENVSEDVEYSRKIASAFGFWAMGWERDMSVFTSQRRIRAMGYIGALRYYVNDNPARRRRLTDNSPDFR